MSRRGGGPTITLFSFQDIITSVSGIMIFVTLLLALDLSERSLKAGDNPAERDSSDLKGRIEAARAELDVLRRRALLDSRSTGRSSLADERAEREAADKLDQAEREFAAIERRSDEARDREAEAKIRREGAEATVAEESQRKASVAEALRRDLADAKPLDRVYFNFEADASQSRDGWLALLDDRGISVAPLGRAQRPRTFIGLSSEEDTVDPGTRAFLDWAESEAQGTYILLVARPSGLERVKFIRREFALTRHAFGIDLVTEMQELLDPEHGVYRP